MDLTASTRELESYRLKAATDAAKPKSGMPDNEAENIFREIICLRCSNQSILSRHSVRQFR